MTARRITLVSFALACALGVAACGKTDSVPTAEAKGNGCNKLESTAKAAQKALAIKPKQGFDGKVVDFECCQSTCDHAHYSIGDEIAVTPNAKDANKFDFKSRKSDGEVNEAELTYSGGYLRGPTLFNHHGNKEEHWLILVPYEKEPWAIAVCNKNPGNAETCDGDQHAGYGHADD